MFIDECALPGLYLVCNKTGPFSVWVFFLDFPPLQSLSHKWKSVYPICWLLSVLAIPLSSFFIIYGQSLSISLGLSDLLDVLCFFFGGGGGALCCRRYLIHFANLHRWPLIMLCRHQLLYDKGCLHTINWDYARKKISWNIKWWNIIKTKEIFPLGMAVSLGRLNGGEYLIKEWRFMFTSDVNSLLNPIRYKNLMGIYYNIPGN